MSKNDLQQLASNLRDWAARIDAQASSMAPGSDYEFAEAVAEAMGLEVSHTGGGCFAVEATYCDPRGVPRYRYWLSQDGIEQRSDGVWFGDGVVEELTPDGGGNYGHGHPDATWRSVPDQGDPDEAMADQCSPYAHAETWRRFVADQIATDRENGVTRCQSASIGGGYNSSGAHNCTGVGVQWVSEDANGTGAQEPILWVCDACSGEFDARLGSDYEHARNTVRRAFGYTPVALQPKDVAVTVLHTAISLLRSADDHSAAVGQDLAEVAREFDLYQVMLP